MAALNVDWSKFVDKGVQALPLSKKTKKTAAARAKKIAAANAAAQELEVTKKQQEEAISALHASESTRVAEELMPGDASPGDTTGAGTGADARGGNGDGAPQSPGSFDRAISGVLASSGS